jgi:hypothetical protein
MTEEKLFKILAAIFAMRAVRYRNGGEDAAALAYDNAFDMLAYAAEGNWDCLSQFSWSDKAEELINKVGANIDFWELEELIKNER